MINYKTVDYNLERKANYKNKEDLIRYLKSHKQIAACPGSFVDPVTKKKLGMNKIFGDDKYRWTESLVYLIEKYQMYIYEDFLRHSGID